MNVKPRNTSDCIRNSDLSLGQLVINIKQGVYRVPKFQRNFVWKKGDIESLGDSFIRGYPISSTLVMPVNGSLKVGSLPLNVMNPESEIDDHVEQKYVLDGQQRITSSGRLFCDQDPKFQYYFDMLAMLWSSFPKEELRKSKYMQSIVECGSSKYPEEDNWCRCFARSVSNDLITSKQNHRYILCKSAIDGEFGAIVSKFLRNFDDLPESSTDLYNNFLNSKLGNLNLFTVKGEEISADSDLGLVCRVFEKVNSTGKKLTAFDLINAKSFETNIKEYQSGFSDYATKIIISKASNDIASLSAVSYIFEESSNSRDCELSEFSNLGRLIRILYATGEFEQGVVPNITNGRLLHKSSDYWFESLHKHIDTIIAATSRMLAMGFLSLIPRTYLEYMLAVICSTPALLNENLFFDTVRDYGLKLSITRFAFSKSNLDIVMKFRDYGNDLLANRRFDKLNISSKPSVECSISPSEVSKTTLTGRNMQAEAIYYIMTKMNHLGCFTHDLTNSKLSVSDGFDRHHIFPRATTKGVGLGVLESLANAVPLSRGANRNIIKDCEYEVYRDKLISTHGQEKVEDIFRRNLMPLMLGQVDMLEFLEARSVFISDYVCSYFNSAKAGDM